MLQDRLCFRINLSKRNKQTDSKVFKATQVVIGAGYEDAAAHRPDELLGTQEQHYSKRYVDIVDLVVTPKEEMTWEMWRFALLGIGDFMQELEYVKLGFEVVVQILGRGGGLGRCFRRNDGSSSSVVFSCLQRFARGCPFVMEVSKS